MTDSMSRLSDEIGASRLARQTFMQKDMANALKGLRNGVEHLLTDFHSTRTKVMKASRADRREFVADLQDKVVGLAKDVAKFRHVMAADLKGARVAFFGSHAARKPAAGSKRSKSKK